MAELVLIGGIEWNVQPAVPALDQQEEEPKTVLLGDNRTKLPLGPHCNRTSPAPIHVRGLVLATIQVPASPRLESVSPGFACMHRRSGSGHSLPPPHHRQHPCPQRLLTILVEPHAPSTSPWSPPLVLRPISLPTRKSRQPVCDRDLRLPSTSSTHFCQQHARVHSLRFATPTTTLITYLSASSPISEFPLSTKQSSKSAIHFRNTHHFCILSTFDWLVHIVKRK